MSASASVPTSTSIGSPPAGCQTTRPENFQLQVEAPSNAAKRSLLDSALSPSLPTDTKHSSLKARDTALNIQLTGGTMIDSQGRIGYVQTSGQFQFNAPPLENQLYIGPFSVCANSSIALGSTTNWYQCLSGDFYNLYYFRPSGGTNCTLINLQQFVNATNANTTSTSSVSTILPTSVATSSSTAPGASQPSTTSTPTEPRSLSGGAIAGIVIGVVAALLIILGILAIVGRRRRKARQPVPEKTGPAEMEGVTQNAELEGHKPPVEVSAGPTWGPPVEAGSVPVWELPAGDVPPPQDRRHY